MGRNVIFLQLWSQAFFTKASYVEKDLFKTKKNHRSGVKTIYILTNYCSNVNCSDNFVV